MANVVQVINSLIFTKVVSWLENNEIIYQIANFPYFCRIIGGSLIPIDASKVWSGISGQKVKNQITSLQEIVVSSH